jgi:nucleoside-specific outer membrane channel protein Tsx
VSMEYHSFTQGECWCSLDEDRVMKVEPRFSIERLTEK